MLDENQMIHPGRSGDDGDVALDAALAAADEDMLAAISNGLDLEVGLARILKDVGGSSTARPAIQAPAHTGQDRTIPDAAISRNPSSRIHTLGADAAPIHVAVLIRDINASNEAAEDQCLRARQAAGIAARSERAAEQAAAEARRAEIAYRAIQAGQPHRRAPSPRQVTLALGTVVLTGLACYLAAQARNYKRSAPGSMTKSPSAGTGGPAPAIAGACLFTAATAGFLSVGYRALPPAETPPAWHARRQARKARQAARIARAAAGQNAAERDRLIDAYLGHVRQLALTTCPAGRQLAVESVIREHLLGELPLGEEQAWHPVEDAVARRLAAPQYKHYVPPRDYGRRSGDAPSAGKLIYRSPSGTRLAEVFGRWYSSSWRRYRVRMSGDRSPMLVPGDRTGHG